MPYAKPGQTHAKCKLGKHMASLDDFNRRLRQTPDGPIWHHDASCRYHQESARHEAKAADPARHVLLSRAKQLADETHAPRSWILTDPRGPQWDLLYPLIRAFLVEHEGRCVNCARPFDSEADTQLDHIHPRRPMPAARFDPADPAWPDDPAWQRFWARHHAVNIRVLCRSCNTGKRDKNDADWVDERYRWQLADADRHDSLAKPKPCGCGPGELCLICMPDAVIWHDDGEAKDR